MVNSVCGPVLDTGEAQAPPTDTFPGVERFGTTKQPLTTGVTAVANTIPEAGVSYVIVIAKLWRANCSSIVTATLVLDDTAAIIEFTGARFNVRGATVGVGVCAPADCAKSTAAETIAVTSWQAEAPTRRRHH